MSKITGHKPQKGYGYRYQIYVPNGENEVFRKAAKRCKGKLSELIRRLVREYVEKEETQ